MLGWFDERENKRIIVFYADGCMFIKNIIQKRTKSKIFEKQ